MCVVCLQIKDDVIVSVGNSSVVDINFVSDAEVHCLLSSATSAQVQVLRCILHVDCTRWRFGLVIGLGPKAYDTIAIRLRYDYDTTTTKN